MTQSKLPNFMPKQSLGDTLDKLTTLTRKVYFGEEDAIEEMNYLIDCLDKMNLGKYTLRLGKFLVTVIRLGQINIEVWNRENSLRRAPQGELPSGMTWEGVGKVAAEIRDLNRKRIHYKNELNRMTKLGFREFKVKHLSQ